jgi:hypothetical protein
MRFTFVILLFFCLGADAQMIIKAHANYRPYAVAAANLLLDDYPNAAAAYSLRKLDKDYTGSAIRVRRSNDNAEQNIGFVGNDLDTASLKTFVGAGNNGFVTVWYDQSGNARNATQTTAANQPRVVNAGTVERQNGKVSTFYDGSNDYLENNTNNFLINNISHYAVSSRGNNANTIRTIYSTGILSGTGNGFGFLYADNSNFASQNNLFQNIRTISVSQAIGAYTNTINTNNLIFGFSTSSSDTTYFNGGNVKAVSHSRVNNGSNGRIVLGARRDNFLLSYDFYLNGTISEIVFWESNQSSNRTGIETNINDYYNIYWNGDFAGLLDSFPSSAAAYSLRNLDKDYLGPLVRVRRSSDNAEQDIFGDYYGNLDTVGLKNFVGANSGFVTTWYDQSGNAINAPQTTAANQPRVVNAGVIDRENSRPTIRYDGTNDHFDLFDVLDIGQNSFLSLSFANITNANATIYAKSVAAASANRYALISEASIIYSFLVTDIERHATASGIGKRLYCSQIIRGASNTLFFNNTQVGQNTTVNNYNLNTNFRFLIGAYNNVSGGGAGIYFLNGTISELVIYLSDQSSNRTGMSNNINTYYSIY